MSASPTPPLAIGALLRFALDDLRERIYRGVVAAGFTDVRPVHVTLFRWPGPDGMRPTEIAAAVQISKQSVNDRLGELERLDYLTREPDPRDSRARVVRLTDRGRRLHEAALAAHASIEREWAATAGQRRFDALCETLAALAPLPGATRRPGRGAAPRTPNAASNRSTHCGSHALTAVGEELQQRKEAPMAKDHGPSIKNDKQYEGLRKKGMSKERAAKIANTPNASKKGGKKSGSRSS
jgi:DNA-binding MarR family transcriptional regulator